MSFMEGLRDWGNYGERIPGKENIYLQLDPLKDQSGILL